eukprot:9578726-Karenia_brevis.AAC.1
MPLDLVLKMWDWYAAKHLERWSKATLTEFPGCYWGSGKGTQMTDVTATNALIVEKGLDLQSH